MEMIMLDLKKNIAFFSQKVGFDTNNLLDHVVEIKKNIVEVQLINQNKRLSASEKVKRYRDILKKLEEKKNLQLSLLDNYELLDYQLNDDINSSESACLSSMYRELEDIVNILIEKGGF